MRTLETLVDELGDRSILHCGDEHEFHNQDENQPCHAQWFACAAGGWIECRVIHPVKISLEI